MGKREIAISRRGAWVLLWCHCETPEGLKQAMQLIAPVNPVSCNNTLMGDSSLAAAQRTLRMTKWARGLDKGLRGSAQLYYFIKTVIPSGTRDHRWLCSIWGYAVGTI